MKPISKSVPIRRPQIKVTPVTLEAGKSWKGTVGLPGVEGTNSLVLEMSDVQPVNLSTRLSYLLGYPHGCVEQITSKAFPQLYLSGVASLTREQEQSTEATVKEVIRRLRSYQTVDGSFSYWPGGTAPQCLGDCLCHPLSARSGEERLPCTRRHEAECVE